MPLLGFLWICFCAAGHSGIGDRGFRVLPLDEYVKQEQDDGVEMIAWLARQSWCTGKVGTFGYSWGGYGALQVAARRPPELKAIITVCSTEDRYAEKPYHNRIGRRGHVGSWMGCPLSCLSLPSSRSSNCWGPLARYADGASQERGLLPLELA
ncbi:MAG: hypothetical protein E5V25_08685 [Mesorhizobium sp.]|nr:MAG: hypothetical protein E5V25_08685 [Mesorhizobium sp.]